MPRPQYKYVADPLKTHKPVGVTVRLTAKMLPTKGKRQKFAIDTSRKLPFVTGTSIEKLVRKPNMRPRKNVCQLGSRADIVRAENRSIRPHIASCCKAAWPKIKIA